MHNCPKCNVRSNVTDSRETSSTVRRRRTCPSCGDRWTTFERTAGATDDGGSWANADLLIAAIEKLTAATNDLQRRTESAARNLAQQTEALIRRAKMIEAEINEKLPEPERPEPEEDDDDDHDE